MRPERITTLKCYAPAATRIRSEVGALPHRETPTKTKFLKVILALGFVCSVVVARRRTAGIPPARHLRMTIERILSHPSDVIVR